MDNNKKERREWEGKERNNWGRKRKVVKQTTEREKGEGNIEREKWNRKTKNGKKSFDWVNFGLPQCYQSFGHKVTQPN